MPKKWPSRQLGICHSVSLCRNCRRFRLAVKSSILCYLWSLKNHRSISLLLFWKCFLLICLPLWTLPTFFKNKNVWKIKNLKNVKNVTKIKNVFTSVVNVTLNAFVKFSGFFSSQRMNCTMLQFCRSIYFDNNFSTKMDGTDQRRRMCYWCCVLVRIFAAEFGARNLRSDFCCISVAKSRVCHRLQSLPSLAGALFMLKAFSTWLRPFLVRWRAYSPSSHDGTSRIYSLAHAKFWAPSSDWYPI